MRIPSTLSQQRASTDVIQSTPSIANLRPYDRDKNRWHVVIETPKGSHNKYKYDDDLAALRLSTVLPEGMAFPYDFGFLPGTVGGDGDPLDVLLLMDEPAFPGCVIPSRLIGVIEAEQAEADKGATDNHRIVAVPLKCKVYSDCKSLKKLNGDRLHEIEQFFVSYNRTRGKCFKVTHIGGPRRAERFARDAIKRHHRRRGRA
jgi:inorganic pyrophosphatase